MTHLETVLVTLGLDPRERPALVPLIRLSEERLGVAKASAFWGRFKALHDIHDMTDSEIAHAVQQRLTNG